MTMRLALGLSMLLTLTTLAPACSGPEPATEYRQGKTILYYPKADVYLDQDNATYFLLDTVEQRWTRSTELPQRLREEALGQGVRIDSASDPVYRDNARHRLVYGTAQFARPGELSRKLREDSLAQLPPKAVPPPATEEPPKKKTKVGRWLQKIFGKKDRSD